MTIAGALAITGLIFAFAAMMLGSIAIEAYGRGKRRLSAIGWVAFALAVGFLIAAAWTAALT